MQHTLPPLEHAGSKPPTHQASEILHTLLPHANTSIRQPDGTELQYDSSGRLVAVTDGANRLLKTFSYTCKGALCELTIQNYKLSRVGREWTDGHQLFDVEVSIDNLGVVTVIEKSCATITRLNPNGSFGVAVWRDGKQFLVQHSARALNPVERVEYPNGEARICRFEKSVMTLLDEDDGYWLKVNDIWMHYNAVGMHDGIKAADISVEFNGTIVFHYLNGTKMRVTASGDRDYQLATTLAA